MGTITIRRLDDTVIEAIKQRAAAAGRSMEEEAR
jgi:plasmid stability protein